ncbi:RHS repeat domain-containing protein [Kallotenue papyrolyticum]|uniref:RHS repeat domain-containing protein n=1 Tax=Kallotenue papyrolyticum TaxID=1325125 RepID=UPI0013774865|nr:RHS repeat-associated core domain-containing protein [Kallotenue papyrolyticum]
MDGTRAEQYTYNAADQVVGWTYDATGNLLNDGTTTYVYDALGRLTSTTHSGSTTTHSYNGEGVLVAQTTSSTTTHYTQDLVAPLSQILQRQQGTQRTDYVYGRERLLALDGTAQTWYGSDALGSVRQTLSSSGAALSKLHYDPWGMPQGGATPPTFGFTGELQDGASGLVYLRARWYQPQHGRFTSRDPFAGWQRKPPSLHPYLYSYNDPINRIDPSGRASRECQSLPAQPVGKSECQRVIDVIRQVVSLLEPRSFRDTAEVEAYRALYAGRHLWNDRITVVLAMYFTGMRERTAKLAIVEPVASLWFLREDNRAGRLRERFMFRPGDGWEYNAGCTACSLIPGLPDPCPAKVTGVTAANRQPSARDQLVYGFKPDLWSNSHHYFFGFVYGASLGKRGGHFINEMFEEVYTPPTSRNPIDVKVGNRAAAIGWAFASNNITPHRLASILETELCLSASKIAYLRRKMVQERN